jgi:hypothetical protein
MWKSLPLRPCLSKSAQGLVESRCDSHCLSDCWLSPDACPAGKFPMLMSSSSSGQWMATPPPMCRQLERPSGDPRMRPGSHGTISQHSGHSRMDDSTSTRSSAPALPSSSAAWCGEDAVEPDREEPPSPWRRATVRFFGEAALAFMRRLVLPSLRRRRCWRWRLSRRKGSRPRCRRRRSHPPAASGL